MVKSIFTAILVLLATSYAFTGDKSDRSNSLEDDYKYGGEFNLVWPFVPGVEIYTGKLTTRLWKSENMRGELLTGLLVRPGTSEDENAETMSEIGIGIGYRQYLLGEFHVEFMIFPSYAQEDNNLIDGEDYSGLAITTELYTGYKLDMYDFGNSMFYLLPQVGIGYNPYSDLGPTTETGSIFPVISCQLGISF